MYSAVGQPYSHPVVEYSVLGHAVGSAELLQLASVVTVQHLLCNARAVGAGTPDMLLATRSQVMLEEQLTVWKTQQEGYYHSRRGITSALLQTQLSNQIWKLKQREKLERKFR